MNKPKDKAGFTPPVAYPLGRERRTVTIAELVTTVALALSTLVAATAVTMGIARADVVGHGAGQDPGIFGTALLLGLLFVVMGCITFIAPGGPRRQRRG